MWTALPEMQEGRSHFNPCVLTGVVYLCGQGSTTVEAFSPETESFLPCQLTLPLLTGACCLYVDNDQLVVLSLKHIHRLTVNPSGQLVLQSEVACPVVPKDQNSHPVVDKTHGMLYFAYDGLCHILNLDTGAEVGLVK